MYASSSSCWSSEKCKYHYIRCHHLFSKKMFWIFTCSAVDLDGAQTRHVQEAERWEVGMNSCLAEPVSQSHIFRRPSVLTLAKCCPFGENAESVPVRLAILFNYKLWERFNNQNLCAVVSENSTWIRETTTATFLFMWPLLRSENSIQEHLQHLKFYNVVISKLYFKSDFNINKEIKW